MISLIYTVVALFLSVVLTIFAYLDRIYHELLRINAGQLHEHVDIFEAEVEPYLKLDRRRAALGFSLLAQLALAGVTAVTTRGVFLTVPEGGFPALVRLVFYVSAEVLLFVQLIPYALLARTKGTWLRPLLPVLRMSLALTWPLRAILDLAISVAHITDQDAAPGGETSQESVEALVEVAQEEGILASDEAQLIEQVVEFSDKRVLELMTPRPDIISISAEASIEDLRRLLVQTRVSRVVVYQGTLDDVIGIAQGQDLLQIPDHETKRRTVKEITQPVLFVPETKLGSELLKEMQSRNQQIAIAVDEHGLVAGVVTVEDMVEEIVGEMAREDGRRIPDIIREPDGTVLLRGSVSLPRVEALFGVNFSSDVTGSATTLAGLLNSIAGHVPTAGEHVDYDSLRFEVLEANQRKVLRLRVRPRMVAAPVA
jgi:putative hemolysin